MTIDRSPVATFDAASLQYAGGIGQSRFESRLSEGIMHVFAGSTIVVPGVAFTNDMMVAVRDLRIDAPGPVTLELNSTGPLHMAIYDPATTLSVRGAAMQFSGQSFGVERLSRTLVAGRHPIVVYRDPTEGTAPLTYSITVRQTPADLELFVFERNDGTRLYNPTQAVASSDLYGDGGDEVLQTVLSTPYPAVVVTKRGSGDVGKTSTFTIEIGNSTVDVPEELPLPTAVRLAPATPNPVSAATTIAFELPRESAVELTAYDVAGRRVASLASGTWQAGRHAVRWAPQGPTGARLASGVYLLRLEAAGVTTVQRVVVTK